MDNKHGELLVIKQSKKCKYMPNMRHNTLGGLDPLWMRSPKPHSRNGDLLVRGTEGRREGTERDGKGIPPPPKSG